MLDPDLEQRLVARALLLAASPNAAASAALVPDSQALQVLSCNPSKIFATCSLSSELGAAAAAAAAMAAAAASVCNMNLAAGSLSCMVADAAAAAGSASSMKLAECPVRLTSAYSVMSSRCCSSSLCV